MKNSVTKLSAIFTFLMYTFSAFAGPLTQESWGNAREIKLQQKIYKELKSHKTPAKSIEENLGKAFTYELNSKINSIGQLPNLSSSSSAYLVEMGGVSVELRPVNSQEGEFSVNGKIFKFRPEQGFDENLDRLQRQLSHGEGWTSRFMNLVFPKAHALEMNTTTMLLIGVGILAAIAIFMAVKGKKKSDGDSERISRLESNDEKHYTAIGGLNKSYSSFSSAFSSLGHTD